MKKERIVQEKDGALFLENDTGCKLQFFYDDGQWGLGTFYNRGVKVGNACTYFACEETVETQYRAQSYRVEENTTEKGRVRFTGLDGKLQFDVVVSLSKGCCCFEIEFVIDPLHPVFHPLYLSAPLQKEHMEFVKYPYEDTVYPDCSRRMIYFPDQARAPFLFGHETLDGESVFVGVGYHLEDAFCDGRLEYDPDAPNPLRIYTPFRGMARTIDLQCVTKLELVRANLEQDYKKSVKTFRCFISVAGSQFDCIRGYIEKCGYKDDVLIKHSIDESKRALYSLYKDCGGYVSGKGYHQLIRFDTGKHDTTVPHGWYSKYIVTGPQILLAYELYLYWEMNPEEAWARDRAFEMSDFLIKMQEPNGMFTNWDTDQNGVSIMHPNDVEGTEFNKCIYSISDMCLGIYYLSMLSDEVKRFEGIDKPEWENGIALAHSYIAQLVVDDGSLGRNYDMARRYDKLTSSVIEALQMFDVAYRRTNDELYAQTRDRLEMWLYKNFISVNNWANGSVDGGAWQGGSWPPPHNNDLMGVFTFASYCVERYRQSGEQKYVRMAKDAIAYIWLSVTPTDIQGFSKRTRSLVREQDFYSIYGVLIRGNDSIESLPFLSKITGDPFFMRFYRIILQTQMDYQAFDQPYAGFHIGLECDDTGRNPIDEIAEGNHGYIIRFASEFLRSVNSPLAYSYVGGDGWGLGADYHLAFEPKYLTNVPYILCAKTMVRNLMWNDKKGELSILLYDTHGTQGEVEIYCPDNIRDIADIAVKIEGTGTYDNKLSFHDHVLSITYRHQTPSVQMKLAFRKDGFIKS